MAKANRNVQGYNLSASLASHFENLIALVDTNITRGDNGNDANGNPITGHERASTGDMGLRILLGQIAGVIHTQLEGGKDARFDTLKARFDKSQQTLNQLMARYADDPDAMSADPQFIRAMHYNMVNEARYDAYRELKVAFTDLYKKVTGESWKPYVAPEKKPEVNVSNNAVKAAVEAAKARMKADVANRQANAAAE